MNVKSVLLSTTHFHFLMQCNWFYLPNTVSVVVLFHQGTRWTNQGHSEKSYESFFVVKNNIFHQFSMKYASKFITETRNKCLLTIDYWLNDYMFYNRFQYYMVLIPAVNISHITTAVDQTSLDSVYSFENKVSGANWFKENDFI